MFLDDVVAHKRALLREKRLPLRELERRIEAQPAPADFGAALRWTQDTALRPTAGWPRLIAEIKKASPSKGLLVEHFDPVALATAYVDSGAAAISVLTEDAYFQGSLEHLAAVRQALDQRPTLRLRSPSGTSSRGGIPTMSGESDRISLPQSSRTGQAQVPVLRKDFLLDPYHVWEARAWGADAYLLIVAILPPKDLRRLLEEGRGLGMSTQVEVHNRRELDAALEAGAVIIGINNRDLATLQVDLSVTEQLRPYIPPGRIVVSESGIQGRADVERLARAGVNAVLVGEALVTALDIADKVKELCSESKSVA